MNEKIYVINQIKKAFWDTFHNRGEVWFGDDTIKEEKIEASIESEWIDFKKNLEEFAEIE